MQSKAATVEQYIAELPEERKQAVTELRKLIKKNLPKGFKEGMSYGMIGYCVPHSIYPKGYHCNPEQPLPFAALASQKNFIAFYHMCVYGDPKLSKWFVDEYAKLNIGKLDMGKSCIRFKNVSKIPYGLIGELCTKVTVQQWIDKYEKILQR
ncbi:DUF1801 domain-containing protein [Ferruginibacter sp. SUN106]|uniref:DUF1801 domain-containing protein n=1 Tax=Ferruginibacter sp. SUN106 TaxID=2978348 RepID=UPI003D36EFC7